MDALPLPSREHAILPDVDPDKVDAADITRVLDQYRTEGEDGRRAGANPRDSVWEANWDRYWGRYDNSHKAAWQSKHVMPEAPQFVDRWAAAMREALESVGEFFVVEDEGSEDSYLAPAITKLMRLVMSRCATTPDGHRTDFTSVFEDQTKLGALMALCAACTWKDGRDGGYVAIDSVDPREVWYDPKLRNLYRRRRYEIDKHELLAMAREAPDLYNLDAIEDLKTELADRERKVELERSSGSSQSDGGAAGRSIIQIDEWLCTVVLDDGRVAANNSLIVVANQRHIIRGPEENPFWHGRDWIVFTPMISVPLSIYGRTYMEDWGEVADAFVQLTQLILDGVFTTTMQAYAANPSMLEDPSQLAEGIHPNVIYQLAEDFAGDPRNFMRAIELGNLPAEAFQVWNALKQEMREGAKLSEIALGQAAPKGRTTAQEINAVERSGSAMIRSMARTIEARFLEPLLHMAWMTALQHMDFYEFENELGPEIAAMFEAQREDFRNRRVQFRVRSISGLIDRQAKLRSLLDFLQIASQNENLLMLMMGKLDMETLLDRLMMLFGLDPSDFQPSQRELLMRQAMAAQQQGQQPNAGQ